MSKKYYGNILGSPNAEADSEMLSKAFVETADFFALVETHDYNFVVGRRGTGKSALFKQVTDTLSRKSQFIVLADTPNPHYS